MAWDSDSIAGIVGGQTGMTSARKPGLPEAVSRKPSAGSVLLFTCSLSIRSASVTILLCIRSRGAIKLRSFIVQ
jgi:hypothetical protein